MSELNLTNHFLIAMPAMTDPFFAKSLTYVCEHNEQGAMGIVVNRPISLTLSELFAQINMPLKPVELEDVLVHFGGPVQTDRGFGCVPGSVRRRLLYRQGHLRRGRLRGGAGWARTRVHPPQP